MTEQTLDRRSPRGGEHPWHGIVWIVLAGTILGLGYNWLGLESRRPWGLTWIAEDKVEALGDTVVELQGNMGAGAPVSDDPLAIPAPTAGLPPIPDVGRPVQIELGAVKAYFDADAALLIDAREPEEYAESHIPGSINLCELSISLAEELYFTGFSRVAVYMGGFPAWVEAGYPIDKATQ
jgi:rhodanese-related sulfurtransferase